jgi:hypothetical protein
MDNYCSVCGNTLHGFVRCMCKPRKFKLNIDLNKWKTGEPMENCEPIDDELRPIPILNRELKKLKQEVVKLNDELKEKELAIHSIEGAIKHLKERGW